MKNICTVLLALLLSGSISEAQSYIVQGTPGTSQSNSNIYQNVPGLIGIGTILPKSTLHVATQYSRLSSTNPQAGVEIVNSQDDDGQTDYTPFSFMIMRNLLSRGGSSTYYDLVAISNGNIGVWTDKPTSTMTVVTHNGSDATPIAGIAIENSASGTLGEVYTPLSFSITRTNVQGTNINDTYHDLVVTDKGMVGIRTATPSQALDVDGTTKTVNFQMTHGAATGDLLQSDASGNASWVIPSSVGAGLWSLAANSVDICNTGLTNKVGIGTNKPQANLQVNGTVMIGSFAPSVLPIGASPSPDPLTAGGYSLYVQYGILTEKVKVALTNGGNWSDYVFDKDYKLANLDEVRSYIDAHHHLPGVPSADEVSCDGIDLGTMKKLPVFY